MKSYNTIYEKLVSNEYDFVGMVAYAIYKKSKLAYIEDHSKKYGNAPQDSDLKAFHLNSLSNPQLRMYQINAEKIIEGFVVQMAQDKVEEIEKKMIQMEKQMKDEKNHFIERINELKPSKWYIGVLQSILAAFIVLFFYVVAVVHFNVFGLRDGIEKRIIDKTTPGIQTRNSK
ncbi:MAG: hypothetical protein MUF15_03195 [Acidobacteria bacterium]|jgi:hypothetical protein|nr:hypothetical protein [Acidobacteriota bacterium]